VEHPLIRPEILRHYGRFAEADRLATRYGVLERVRTEEILKRVLPAPPACIVDVGGGPGVYATWLAGLGYEVHLIDPVPRHIDQALAAAAAAGVTLASARRGVAAGIERDAESADVVLLMGPLYHLPELEERLAALMEARRLLRSGGIVAAAAITRFASALDALDSGFIDNPAFMEIVDGDLSSGRHVNPTNNPDYFTTAYFHEPDELAGELADAGFSAVEVLAVEGIGWIARDFADRLENQKLRDDLLGLIRVVETEPSLFGASPHLLAFGTAP
jgi:SAM-dependent methyltransferase